LRRSLRTSAMSMLPRALISATALSTPMLRPAL